MRMLMSRTALSIALLAVAGGAAPAEVAWEGRLDVGGGAGLTLVLRVKTPENGPVTATFASLEQGAAEIKADSVTLDKTTLKFQLKSLDAEFSGTRNAAGDEAAGQFTQRGKTFPLTLKVRPDAAEEVWEGKLELGSGIGLRLVLRVAEPKVGPIRATFASPDQGAALFPVDTIRRDKETLAFAIKALGIEYSAKINPAGTEAAGQWKQAGVERPLTLKKVAKATEVRRPQTPKPPFPYNEERLAYENKKDGVTLAATLTTPRGPGPFPAVILISGSGVQDRDETLFHHKPFLVIADALTRRGIAVLRVDDRGVGGSSGNSLKATSDDFAGDVLAGVAFLKSRKDIDAGKIGLIGHSEGGIIAPIVAARSDDVAFIVLMAGTGLPGNEIVLLQSGLIAEAMGENAKTDAMTKVYKRLFDVIKTENDEKTAMAKMRAVIKEAAKDLPEAERDKLLKVKDAQLAILHAPWFRFFLTFDPRPTLAKVRCPVLAVNGGKDLQVPPRENLGEIEKALKSGGNRHVTIKELPGLNHLFQTCRTGAPSEYATIEETFAPAALTLIGDWIEKQVKTDR